jgi:nucleoside-diphosphate-sugar epimerase
MFRDPDRSGTTDEPMRKAIVSGGNGFIGSALIEQLVLRGVEVHALVNENHQRLAAIIPQNCIHGLKGEVSSAVEIVKRVQPDTIFHLAAVYAEPVSTSNVLSMLDGNLALGACLLFAATQCSKQPVFINAGTYWQFDVNSAYSPNTLYAATKHAFQDLLHFYRDRLSVAAMTLILYDTFGETDTRPKLWHSLTTAPVGKSFRLSPGEQTIHLIHIDDTVNAFFRAAELLHSGPPPEPIYSVPSQTPLKLRFLVETLNAAGHLGLDLQWGAIPYWEGQVFEPWVGEVLPGWRAEVDVVRALLAMAQSHRASTLEPHLGAPYFRSTQP